MCAGGGMLIYYMWDVVVYDGSRPTKLIMFSILSPCWTYSSALSPRLEEGEKEGHWITPTACFRTWLPQST